MYCIIYCTKAQRKGGEAKQCAKMLRIMCTIQSACIYIKLYIFFI